jgi:hypothetical protein
MKKTILISLSLFYSIFLSAQSIPNAGMENWSTDTLGRLDPDGWFCSNLITDDASVMRDVGRTGVGYSAKLLAVPGSGVIPDGGHLSLDDYPYSGPRPAALKGYWKTNNVSGADLLIVHIYMYNSAGDFLGDKSVSTPIFSSVGWSPFIAIINYTSADTNVASYSLNIGWYPNSSNSLPSYGAVDDLSFDFNTGVEEISPDISDMMVYPSGENFQVKFNLSKGNNIKVNILDITGREVLTVKDEFMSAGIKEMTFDRNPLHDGIYTCVITNGSERRSVIFSPNVR